MKKILPDIAKSRDASMDFAPHPDEAEQLPVLSQKLPFSVDVFLQIAHRLHVIRFPVTIDLSRVAF